MNNRDMYDPEGAYYGDDEVTHCNCLCADVQPDGSVTCNCEES